MKQPARLIIPVWGERYVDKVLSITLPAVLAPGNMPALCRNFDVELVIVTESRLFDLIRRAPAFQAAARVCATKLAALDDVLTDFATDYGITLTHALFRGFSDLGPRMTETYLLFLNADFIVCDGALAHLGALMQEGKRVIHAPSFRVVVEDVSPHLAAAIDGPSGTLALPAREMVKLALTHKHPTVKARTVNQRLCHQAWMDQFYWYVDEDTLIGYQAPVALVAIKPERLVTEPVVVWDFGFLPEAAPTAPRHFITDSDDFFMIEPQSRDTGSEMIRVGWTSYAQVARDLSMWLTAEQRKSSKQLLTIHAADLPPDIGETIEQSRAYMAEVDRRMATKPASHTDHPRLGRWFRETTARRRDAAAAASSPRQVVTSRLLDALQTIYRKTFGSPPRVGLFHPLRSDMFPITQAIAAWGEPAKQNTLWVSSGVSLFQRRLGGDRVDLSKVLSAELGEPIERKAPYDTCICELSLLELLKLDRLYPVVRSRVKDGGHILIYVVKRGKAFEGAGLVLQNLDFPSVDVSQIHFWGDATTWFLGRLYLRALRSFQSMPVVRALLAGSTLLLLAPVARLANARAALRDATIFRSTWTSLTIEFAVRRGHR
ncbi:MAG TPA: hypothetical protein VH684_10935 [Xanthobacteraceae bacterium]|jgi:hypothetical protein